MTRRWTPLVGLRRTTLLLLTALLATLLALPGSPAVSAIADQPVIIRDRTWSVRGGPSFAYGRSSDVHLMGDWDGNGTATPGVFRRGRWYLRNTLASGATTIDFTYGRAGDIPIVGDWDGDGRTSIGIVRGTTWRLRNRNSAGDPHVTFSYGRRGDVPVTGDWNRNGRTGIGVVRGNRWRLRNALSAGDPQADFTYGRVGDVPVTGDWNGDGRTTPGVVRGSTWYLRDQLTSGSANRTFVFGRCGDAELTTAGAQTSPGVPTSLRGTEWARLPTTEKVVALTFDAGANADGIPSILKTLADTNTPATFFLTGDWTTRFPTYARQVAAGYPVGNHTATHPDLTTLGDAAVRQQIIEAQQTIRTTTGVEPRPWFRFPLGARDARTISLANCLDHGSVRWTVDTLGWKGTSGGQSTTSVANRVLDTLQPGSVVLLHVGSHPRDHSTLDAAALPTIIRKVEERGYRFVSLDAYR